MNARARSNAIFAQVKERPNSDTDRLQQSYNNLQHLEEEDWKRIYQWLQWLQYWQNTLNNVSPDQSHNPDGEAAGQYVQRLPANLLGESCFKNPAIREFVISLFVCMFECCPFLALAVYPEKVSGISAGILFGLLADITSTRNSDNDTISIGKAGATVMGMLLSVAFCSINVFPANHPMLVALLSTMLGTTIRTGMTIFSEQSKDKRRNEMSDFLNNARLRMRG